MSITKFSYEEKQSGWKLNEVSFVDFNLLVGKSGVGKTKILDALYFVCRFGTSVEWGTLNDFSWEIQLEIGIDTYTWKGQKSSARSNLKDANGTATRPHHVSLTETIIKNQNEVLVSRDQDTFIFKGEELPRLTKASSAISLLEAEDSIQPIYKVLKGFYFRERWEKVYFSIDSGVELPMPDEEFKNRWLGNCPTLGSMREDPDDPKLYRAYMLQEYYRTEFDQVKALFQEMFPQVIDIRLGALGEFSDALPPQYSRQDVLVLGIREEGIEKWILERRLSEGMLRVLNYLFEITLAPSDSVIVIDEVENSLGINCLPQLIEYFLRRADLQFILTSHHPYVINNIPVKYWKLVTRKGSEVTVKNASELPALSSVSSLEKFTQLMNLEEYEEAIG